MKLIFRFKTLVFLTLLGAAVFTGWEFLHEIVLCCMIAFAVVLLLLLKLEIPSRSWLRLEHIKKRKASVGKYMLTGSHYEESVRAPVSVATVCARIQYFANYNAACERVDETEEFLDESEAVLTKAVVMYSFACLMSIFGYFQVKGGLSDDDLKIVETAKFYGAYVYLAMTLAYATWMCTESFSHRKRNRL
jgi:hypothetical protein